MIFCPEGFTVYSSKRDMLLQHKIEGSRLKIILDEVTEKYHGVNDI